MSEHNLIEMVDTHFMPYFESAFERFFADEAGQRKWDALSDAFRHMAYEWMNDPAQPYFYVEIDGVKAVGMPIVVMKILYVMENVEWLGLNNLQAARAEADAWGNEELFEFYHNKVTAYETNFLEAFMSFAEPRFQVSAEPSNGDVWLNGGSTYIGNILDNGQEEYTDYDL